MSHGWIASRVCRAVAIVALAVAMTAAAHADGSDLEGRWLAEKIGGGVVDRLQTRLEIRDDGAVSGSGGCNRYSGEAEIVGDGIRFGAIASTRMACPPAAMNQEQKFFDALSRARSWTVEGPAARLTLRDESGNALVILARAE